MPRGRYGAHVEVFERDASGQRRLVHTSLKRLPRCVACRRELAGDAVLLPDPTQKSGNVLVHANCGRTLGG